MNSAEVLIKFKGDTKDAEESTKKMSSQMQALAKTGEKAFLGMTTAVAAMSAAILKTGIQYNAEIETYLTRLTTLTGSATKANKILEQIKKDALATPFEVSSLTQAESLLLATGLSAEDARKDIIALGDAIAASGGGNEELSRMAVNLQQIRNVGKASALDIKQFAYAGIDIYGLLADSMGITRKEASQLDVTYDMLSNALQKASQQGGKYYKAMEKQSQTYTGAVSNLKEAFNVFAGDMAKGLFNTLKGLIPHLTKMFNWLSKNKNLILGLIVPLGTFISVFSGFLIIGKIVILFKALWAVMATNPVGLVVAAVAALIAGFMTLWNNCEGFRNFWIGLWEVIKEVIGAAVEVVLGVFDNIVNYFKIIWSGIQALIITPFVSAFNVVTTKFNTLKNMINNVINKIRSGFTTAANAIKTAFNGVRDFISNIFQAIGNIVKSPINGIVKGMNKLIDKINSLKVPDWVPLVGGKHTNFKHIPMLETGTNYVKAQGLAYLHEGEAVVPKKFNPYANGINQNTINNMNNMKPSITNVTKVDVDIKQDNLGQIVKKIKTYSGGSPNDYNYGAGW